MPLSRHVLAVDDNPDVLDVLLRILQQLGYVVSSTTSARVAAGMSDHALSLIGLLITDIDMPEMDGYALADALRARRPTLPVLLVSGSNTIAARSLIGDGVVSFLPKPFTVSELEVAVVALLSGRTEQLSTH
ncbi:MAG: response regulator [Gemmatimonadaceae bacterium]|nr:response regulator [Gemmatimonadaceae bacterium]